MITTGSHFDFNPMTAPHRDDPHPFYSWSRDEAPICFSAALNAYLVTRYDDVKTIVDDPETFSSANAIPRLWDNPAEVLDAMEGMQRESTTVVNADGPTHAPLRRLVAHAFSGRRVRQHLPAMKARAAELVDSFTAGASDSVDLVGGYADPYVQTVVSLAFGIPSDDVDRVQSWTVDYLTLLSPMAPTVAKIEAAARLHDYERYIDALAERRRAEPREDFVSDLVHGADDAPPVSQGELRYIFRGLRFAGHDTTRDLLCNALLLMLRDDGRLWRQALTERRMLPRIVEETLRHEAPHRGLMRVTTRDVVLHGVSLPAGTSLLLMFGSANRDERHFPEPDAVNIHRPNVNDHLAFGAGTHSCTGAQLARTEVRVALETLLDRVPTLRLAPDHTDRYVASFFFRGLERLDVTW
jgi:cytochrome P450